MIYENYKVKNPVIYPLIPFDSVQKIYVGKDNVCRCGCAGKYYLRGDKMFNRMINQFKKLAEAGCIRTVETEDTYINVPFGDDWQDKAYTFYFEK